MATRSWNKVELMGNLTRDPELRYTASGAAVCTFGLATNRTYLVDGERREDGNIESGSRLRDKRDGKQRYHLTI